MTRKHQVLFLVFLVLIPLLGSSFAAGAESYSAWVTLGETGLIKIVDTGTFRVESTLNVTGGKFPWGIAFTPDGQFAYVVCRDTNNVVVIDANSLTEVDSVNVGREPFGIRVSRDGKRAYVTNSGDATLSIIDTETNTVTTTINVGDEPLSIDITPDGSRAYIVLRKANQVAIVQLSDNRLLETIPMGNSPWGIAITPDGRNAYVSVEVDKEVWAIRLSDNVVTAKMQLSGEPRGVAVSPNGARVFAAYSEAVAHIDANTNQVIDGSGIHAQGWGLAVTPDNRYVLATTGEHTGAEGVEVVDISRMEKIETIFLGEETFGPRGIAIRPVSSGKILTSISCNTELQVQEGASVSVYGSISPPLDGKTITVTFTRPDGSETTTTTTSLSDGSYNVSYMPDVKGTWKAQASWSGDGTYEGAVSSLVSINYGVSGESIDGPGPLFLVLAVVIIVIVLVAVVLRRRKSKIKKKSEKGLVSS